jgi:hypothetical protein
MLWYKAWRETRARFLLSFLVLTALCLYAVFFPQTKLDGRHIDYHGSVYKIIYFGFAKGVFCMLLLFLGLGGLRRELANHTASFTLALPIGRLHLMAVPLALGVIEMAVLSLLPAFLLPLLSTLVQQSYPVSEALQFSVLWLGFGSPIFAAAFFFSVIASSEWVAPLATFLLLIFQGYFASAIGIHNGNIMAAMNGFGTVSSGPFADVMAKGFPWEGLSICGSLALVLLAISARIVQRQNY